MDNNISVLIIEDEAIWSNELRLMLADLGFDLATEPVNNIEDALTALRTIEYDIVLLDINLNGKNSGLELGKSLHEVYKKPYIFITGNSDGHSLAEAVKCGPSAYLTKPANKASLYVSIQTAIQNFMAPSTVAKISVPVASYFFVKLGHSFKKIEWESVCCLSATKNYIKAVVKNDNHSYFFRSSLQNTLKHIIPSNLRTLFIQINRSEVVNVLFIDSIQGNKLMTNFDSFTIGDGYIDDVKRQLNIVM